MKHATFEKKEKTIRKIRDLTRDGMSLSKAINKQCISKVTYYNWKKCLDKAMQAMEHNLINHIDVVTEKNEKNAIASSRSLNGESGKSNAPSSTEYSNMGIEQMITERNVLLEGLNAINSNLKKKFERIRELEQTIQF